eukprot:CAMPEP_0202709556 /NCGR_PEP_ID=MMETSP1385-20130828/21653_1 /ASSEMBLY_ACC=CAM_ASM_000861 /TAXON_ID=933848 /ORGANISM="Elphidium margaritaceum" /LENGTH=320 /DNA_ID=CAMNT_0049368845 /DNA_START=53 /DNA_END=1015 /DNA_ORIENTATION=+
MALATLVWIRDTAVDTAKKYPAVSVGCASFVGFYVYRTYKTAQEQRKQGLQVSLTKRFANSTISGFGVAAFALHPFVFSLYPETKPLHVAVISSALGLSWCLNDYFFSPIDALRHNVSCLRANGFSMPKIVTYTLLGVVAPYVCDLFFVRALDLTGYDLLKYDGVKHLLLSATIPRIVMNLVVDEILFYPAHVWLHRSKIGAVLHQFHHCCYTCSLSSGIMFNPLDEAIEFALSIYPTLILTQWWHGDKVATLLSLAIMAGWYGANHDENLRLSHSKKHHGYCLGYYTAYVEKKESAKNDEVRDIMVKGYGYRKSKDLKL